MAKNVDVSLAPLRRHTGGVWIYKFLTSAIGGGEWSESHSVCFITWERIPVTIQQELIWKFREEKNLLILPGFKPRIVILVP